MNSGDKVVHEQLFAHVGIVVPNLETAKDHFTELFGTAWNPVREVGIHALDRRNKDVHIKVRICLSIQEPGFELIEEVAGSPWVCNEHSNLHHLAFSSGTVATTSDRFESLNCPLEFMLKHPDGTPYASVFHRDPIGVWFEVQSPQIRR